MELIEKNVTTIGQFRAVSRPILKKYQLPVTPNDQLIMVYRSLVDVGEVEVAPELEKLLRLKRIRSTSGIVVVSVLTKPYPCPGKCIFCPAEANIPKSYFSNEPAVMRALTNKFDPYDQVKSRLKALQDTGHITDKISIRIIGGTWSYYKRNYQTWFVKRLFMAANEFGRMQNAECRMQNIGKVQLENEEARCRIVELTVETRQDYINPDEIKRLRMLGVTKVELGVQSLYDDVLTINKRGHNLESTINATKLLKDAGFKVSYQMMLNLYGSNIDRDAKMFATLFTDPRFVPDHLKIYPLALVKQSALYKIYQQGLFKPYSEDELKELLIKVKMQVPYYCRIERVIRDIPSNMIVAGGSKITNFRQIIALEMQKRGLVCKCVRCREIANRVGDITKARLFRQDYDASDGREIYLSYESPDRSILFSMLRLRIPANPIFTVLKNSSLIREIHTYGPIVGIGENSEESIQHQGLGKKLIAKAEKISREEYGLKHITAISGIGVRSYFAKLGYKLSQTYMTKNIRIE